VNHLLIGTADKTERLLSITKPRFLLIDDGPIADAFLAHFPKARLFDPAHHSFDPLKGMDYKRARDFADTLYSASPGGENTLTVRNGRRALVRLLVARPRRLTDLPSPVDTKDDVEKEALAMVEDLLLSPILRQVLCAPKPNFRIGEGTTVAKLDRAQLGDFDAFVLASLLIGQHEGQIVVPDFGFYGRPLHMSLIRQRRLTAGVNALSELKKSDGLSEALLTFPNKYGQACTYKDAVELANAKGLVPDLTRVDNDYNNFIRAAVDCISDG
jgi:hypothetical protein